MKIDKLTFSPSEQALLLNNPETGNNVYQVHIRFRRRHDQQDLAGDPQQQQQQQQQQEDFPPRLSVTVNGVGIPLYDAAGLMITPLDITGWCKINSVEPNSLSLVWNSPSDPHR